MAFSLSSPKIYPERGGYNMKELDFSVEWTPSPEIVEKSNLHRILQREGLTYEEFLRRSNDDPEWFWRMTLRDMGFRWDREPERILDLSRGKEWAKWFVGGRLNITKVALDYRNPQKTALIYEGEDGTVRKYTYGELLSEVNRLSNALIQMGVGEGDRVGIYLPMIPEVVISLLAVSRIGAIAVPLFSGFGPEAIEVRLGISEARAVITADGFRRRGKPVRMKETLDKALERVPSVERVLVVRKENFEVPMKEGRDYYYDEIVGGASANMDPPVFDSETPLMIIYTSGTTGRPKGAVHVHAGFPVKAAQDMFHLFDIKEDDVITWLTDMGWMMGPWLVFGSLINGATMFIYDGSPDYPGPDRMWQMVEKHGISILGLSPTFVRAVMAKGDEWVEKYDMPTLRLIGSTGEPWNPEPWRWTLHKVGKGRAPIINYSGGTEISGGILGCVVIRPLKPMSFNTAVPGVDADVFDDSGRPVREEIGYLVIKNVNPGMTRGFWKENDRYIETYWSRFPGVWYHGDLAYRDAEDYWYILGRADDTIKIAGKRVGPAEYESVLVEHPAVKESAVVGVSDELKGQVPVAFVVLKEGHAPSDELKGELLELVRNRMGKAFALKDIHFVSDLPKTRNAKIMRRVIRRVYEGQDPGDLSALVNPDVVREIESLRKTGGES